MTPFIDIKGRKVGPGYPAYIVAEMSGNHHHHYEEAVELLKAVKAAGADAIKLQTYTADTLTIRCDKPPFQIGEGTLWSGMTLHDLYSQAFTPWEWHTKLQKLAKDLGLDFFSTPFDSTAVEFLEKMDVPVYKIASFEIVDVSLLKKVGQTGKPVILSTGMADLAEIDEAVNTLRLAGCPGIALLKCTSAYPANPQHMNLRTLPHLSQAFQVPVGLSDHTLGITVPIAAVAQGACIIEKHITLSRQTPGPDSAFSLETAELKAMVDSIRIVEKALGHVQYGVSPDEVKSLVFRRSLFVVEDIREGELLTERNVRSIRPGYGLHTRFLPEVIGRRASKDIARGTPLAWDMVGSTMERVSAQ